MNKDSRVSFRISSSVKSELDKIAKMEGRSTAQIVDAFLKAGIHAYRKRGTKSVLEWLAVTSEERSRGE